MALHLDYLQRQQQPPTWAGGASPLGPQGPHPYITQTFGPWFQNLSGPLETEVLRISGSAPMLPPQSQQVCPPLPQGEVEGCDQEDVELEVL